MRVTLVAKTEFIPPAHIPWEPHEGDSDSDALSEMSGRLCYLSWNRPNPKTATNAGYIGNIIDHEHFSVMEHSSATFLVEGVSRSLSLELIRHRHLSFSQVSQRYCKEDDANMVVPPAISEATGGKDLYPFVEAGDRAVDAYVDIVEYLEGKGYTRKQAREAARAVLPNATETKIVVTGNMRAWRDVLKKRYSVHADAEIRALATELLRQLRGIAPNSFSDIPDTPYE